MFNHSILFTLLEFIIYFHSGLSLVLFLQNYEFLEGISLGYGTRLSLHAQGTKPVPDEEGLFISSASETNIGLSKVSPILLTEPVREKNNILGYDQV